MALIAHEADRNNEDDCKAVIGAVNQVLAERGIAQASDPDLAQMADGVWAENVTICGARDAEYTYGLMACKDDPDNRRMVGFALNVDATLPATRARLVVQELIGHGLALTMLHRRQWLVVDATRSLPLVEPMLGHWLVPGDREGEWRSPEPMSVVFAKLPPYGQGGWAVVVHNDEVTTMDVVTNALRAGVGLTQNVAIYMMFKVHFNGRAAVRRHYFRWFAQRTKARLDRFFQNAGFQTRVEIVRAESVRDAQ